MTRGDQERLQDIKDAIVAIHKHLIRAGQNPIGRFRALVQDAVLFQFVAIGEAVKNLSPETRASAPEIAWADIAGIRDLIAHEYFRIDIDRVRAIAERDLPPLEEAIDRLLSD